MEYGKGVGGGFAGGAVVAVLWCIISFAVGAELNIIGVAIGFAVGFGMRMLAKPDHGVVYGVLAVVITLVMFPLGKYIAKQVSLERQYRAVEAKAVTLTDDDMMTREAKTISGERVRFSNKPMVWPAGKNALSAEKLADFPADIAQEATTRWNAKSATDKEKLKTNAADQEKRIRIGQVNAQFGAGGGLGGLDYLWIVISLPGAFFLGAGKLKSADGEEEDFEEAGGLLRAKDADDAI